MTTGLTIALVCAVLALVALVSWTQDRIYKRLNRIEAEQIEDYVELATEIVKLRQEVYLLTGHHPDIEPESPNE